jgi:hypothetical protein
MIVYHHVKEWDPFDDKSMHQMPLDWLKSYGVSTDGHSSFEDASIKVHGSDCFDDYDYWYYYDYDYYYDAVDYDE